ncbi:hypothetical protein EVG20_g2705 [Dentipellis fragilis]|uniref:Epoxide hydrolase N-terminal domain-containing protein n=1 Tax=Dentipellis fragilis TaxID=205917 RepID=A0A4Y9Z920_9AGAM|nr:hypothetical protein EVG20_g2705 [Dentipellis fragilis]
MSLSNENPFTISIPDDALALLHQKLALTRFPDELDDANWEYGAPLADVKRLVAHWMDGYDWRKAEALLNTLPMFTCDIPVDGFGELNVHYVHQKSAVEGAIPLLFVHGWPGSFIEVRKVLPLLMAEEEEKPSFHVVALSLPGFGFSEAPKKKGFGLAQYAEVAHKLMLALGYEEYVTQGGDWGSHITGYIAHLYGPKHVKACHSNFPCPPGPSWTSSPLIKLRDVLSWYTPEEKAGLARKDEFAKTGRGYNQQQSTRPQTLGYALADSPVGLLAWIYEKLVTWTDAYPWEDDEGTASRRRLARSSLTWDPVLLVAVLTWVSIYWFSRAGPTASARIYFEHAQRGKGLKRFTVPLGVSRFPKELNAPPKSWLSLAGNVVFDSWHPSGGHFAAHEKPEELVGDLKKMFGREGAVYGIVPGRSGMSSFPTEILLSIADVASPRALRSLRATSKTWHGLATATAFRSLCVRDRARSAQAFVRILEDNVLAQYVQEVVFQDSSANYYGQSNDEERTEDPDIEKTIETVEAAFSLLHNVPNLSALRLVFHPEWMEEDAMDIDIVSDELRTERAVLTGVTVAAASPNLTLRSLTLLNLSSIHDPAFDQPAFHNLLSPLQHLHIANKCVGYDHEGFNELDPYVEFWTLTIPQCFLLPASLYAGSALTTLALHSAEDLGLAPNFSLADFHYPHLTSLSLRRILFHESTGTEEFILRHKDTLTRLELRECKIGMEDFADVPEMVWSVVYGRLADGLQCLTELLVEERWELWWKTMPLRYAGLDAGFGYLPPHDEDLPEGDAEALESFRAVVAARKARARG